MTMLVRAVELLEAGDWPAAHELVQDAPGAQAAWAHGIVHLLEGDFDNAAYWYRRADRAFTLREVPAEGRRGLIAGFVAAEIAALRTDLDPKD